MNEITIDASGHKWAVYGSILYRDGKFFEYTYHRSADEYLAYCSWKVALQNQKDLSVPDPILRFETARPKALNSFGFRQPRTHARPRMRRR